MTKKFENSVHVFTLQMQLMFLVYTTFEKFEIAAFTVHFRFVLEKDLRRGNHMTIASSVPFSKMHDHFFLKMRFHMSSVGET